MESRKILLMDRDLSTLEEMGSALKGAGYDVTALNDDSSALLLLEKKRFPLVVTGFFSGDNGGAEFLEDLKSLGPNTMVILLASRADVHGAVSALRLGADDYFLKPCDPQDLIAGVARCFTKMDRRNEARLALRNALHEKDRRFQGLVDMLEEGYLETDAHGIPTFVNQHLSRLLGYTREELVAMKIPQFMVPRHADMFLSLLLEADRLQQPAKLLGLELIRKDGSPCRVDLYASLLPGGDGDPVGVRSVLRDISGQEKAADQMVYTAYHDPLTGLKNRRALFDRLEESLVFSQRYKTEIALLLIAMDHLGEAIERYGHQTGEEVITAAADRLRRALRKSDFVFRFGDSEFAVLLTNPEKPVSMRVARRIRSDLQMPYANDINGLQVTIGISLSSDECSDPIQMIYHADRALLEARGRKEPEAVRACETIPAGYAP